MPYFFSVLAEALKYQKSHDNNKHQAEQKHSQQTQQEKKDASSREGLPSSWHEAGKCGCG